MHTSKRRLIHISSSAFLVAALIGLTTACGDSGDNTGSADDIAGWWATEGYGYVAELGTATRVYEVSAASCIPAELNPAFAQVTQAFENASLLPDDRAFVPMEWRTSPLTAVRIDGPPESCRNGGTPTIGEEGYVRSPELVFDVLWSTFDREYAFFDLHGVNWGALRDEYEKELDPAMTDEALFELLGNLVRELDDGHVLLVDPATEQIVSAASVPEAHQAFYEEFQAQTEVESWTEYELLALTQKLEIIETHYLGGEARIAANNMLRYGRLDPDTGYLGIDAMGGYTDGDSPSVAEDLTALNAGLDQAFDSLADTDHLVVDVRLNGGGYDLASFAILSRLVREPVDVFIKQARDGNDWTEPYTATVEPSTRPSHPQGKLVLLTSALTASAAETFTMGTLGMPNVTRIGEATEGIFSDMLVRVLPNGWLFSLSNERFTDPRGSSYEGIGVPVDTEVSLFLRSDLEQGIDSGLEAAIAELSGP